MNYLKLLLFLFCISLHPITAECQTKAKVKTQKAVQVAKLNVPLFGKSIKVDDGDTFIFLDKNNRQIKIRIEGIDAPEKGMPYARKSKEYLAGLLLNQDLVVVGKSYDQYKRMVAQISVGKQDVSAAMIASGYAWHYKKFNQEKKLSDLELKAKSQRLGLWQENSPMPPWKVRAYRRAGYSDAEFRMLRKQNSPAIRKYLE